MEFKSYFRFVVAAQKQPTFMQARSKFRILYLSVQTMTIEIFSYLL